jgi:uncharacterized protein (TIGR02391 family)
MRLPTKNEISQLAVDDLAIRLLQLAAHHQQGHLLSRSNATAPTHWGDVGSDRTLLRAVGEAWDWLYFHGLIANEPQDSSDWTYITERGHRVAGHSNPIALVRAEARLDVELHPILEKRIRRQFLIGEYELAAFAAMREVEIRLRKMSGASESDIGVKLAKDTLKPGGTLADPELDRGEQEATMALFWGALGVFKNPPSHRQVIYNDPTLASEVVLLADLLMRMLDNMLGKEAFRRAKERIAAAGGESES